MSRSITRILLVIIVVGGAVLLYRFLFPAKSAEELYREDPVKFVQENKEKYLGMFKNEVYPLLDSIEDQFQLMMDEMINETPPEEIQERFREKLLGFKFRLAKVTDEYGDNYLAAGVRMEEMLPVIKRLDSVMMRIEPSYDALEAYGVDLDPLPMTKEGINNLK